jgi:hypothetical protein
MVLPEQQCFSVRNDAAGWAELVERLRGLSISFASYKQLSCCRREIAD